MVAFEAESWIWWSVGMAIGLARLVARISHLGSIKKLQADDYLMMLAMCSHTAFIVTINKVVNYNSNLIQPGTDVYTLSQEDIDERIYGSKLTVVVEQMQCLTTWTLKACLVCLYWRVTQGFKTNLAVRLLAFYVGFTYVVMEILYLFVWCRPFKQYWQVIPLPNIQCSAAINHLITNAVFNISSDVCMLGVAFSLFLGNRLPLSRKLALCAIFGLGLFTILCAILNKYYSFTHPFGSEWTYWYVRESSTALIVANMPFTWSILRRVCGVKAFNPTSGTVNGTVTMDQNHFRSPNTSRMGSVKVSGSREHGNSEDTIVNDPNFPTTPTSPTWSSHYGLYGRRQTSPEMYTHPKYGPQRKLSSQPDWKRAGISGKQDLELFEVGEGFANGATVAFDFGFANSRAERGSGDSTVYGSNTAHSAADGDLSFGRAISEPATESTKNGDAEIGDKEKEIDIAEGEDSDDDDEIHEMTKRTTTI